MVFDCNSPNKFKLKFKYKAPSALRDFLQIKTCKQTFATQVKL